MGTKLSWVVQWCSSQASDRNVRVSQVRESSSLRSKSWVRQRCFRHGCLVSRNPAGEGGEPPTRSQSRHWHILSAASCQSTQQRLVGLRGRTSLSAFPSGSQRACVNPRASTFWVAEMVANVNSWSVCQRATWNSKHLIRDQSGLAALCSRFEHGLPLPQRSNIFRTIVQRRFLLNASSKTRSGFLNMQAGSQVPVLLGVGFASMQGVACQRLPVEVSKREFNQAVCNDGTQCRFGRPGPIRPLRAEGKRPL